MTATWVILGCGYVGERLAARRAEAGDRVILTSRSAARAASLAARLGAEGVAVDVGAPDALHFVPAGALVVDSVPPDPARPAHTAAFAGTAARRIVYLSSTGVYPRGDGSWVDEDTPPAPDSPRGRARLADEEALLQSGADAIILRVAALFGPGRGVEARLQAGTYRVPGDGSNWVSRVHVDDLVRVIEAAARIAAPPRRVYCVADGRPTTARAHADRVAARLGLPAPPSIPVDEIAEEVRDLVLTNRRVASDRLAELGVTIPPRQD